MAANGESTTSEPELAAQVLGKLRGFVESLEPGEREVLAALLAPGVAQAYAPDADVTGFGTWIPGRLPETLAEQVRNQHWRIAVEEADATDV
jgi:hypothetical protein